MNKGANRLVNNEAFSLNHLETRKRMTPANPLIRQFYLMEKLQEIRDRQNE